MVGGHSAAREPLRKSPTCWSWTSRCRGLIATFCTSSTIKHREGLEPCVRSLFCTSTNARCFSRCSRSICESMCLRASSSALQKTEQQPWPLRRSCARLLSSVIYPYQTCPTCFRSCAFPETRIIGLTLFDGKQWDEIDVYSSRTRLILDLQRVIQQIIQRAP